VHELGLNHSELGLNQIFIHVLTCLRELFVIAWSPRVSDVEKHARICRARAHADERDRAWMPLCCYLSWVWMKSRRLERAEQGQMPWLPAFNVIT
jgi:hypothetical protein